MKYNILFSNAVKTSKWGGGEKWMIQAAKNMENRDYSCSFLCRKNSLFRQRIEEAGLRSFPIPFSNSFDIASVFQIYRIIKKNRINIVVCATNLDLKLTGLASRLAGIPIVSRQGLAMFSDKFKYKILVTYFTDTVVTNTCSIKKQYENYHWFPKNHIQVIYNGVETHPPLVSEEVVSRLRQQYLIQPDEKIILGSGRLTHQKGFSYLIEAAQLAAASGQKWKFLILGEGEQRPLLEKQINEYGLSNVLLTGYQKEVSAYYQMADIFVLSSLSEGTPNVVLEAMAHRLPVIATDVNGVSEIIEHNKNGFLITPRNGLDIYKKIEQLLSSPERLHSFKEAGFETVSNKFSWEKFTEEFSNYLNHTLHSYEKNHHKNS